MQDELSAVRSKADFDIVGSLPKRNIDTGMGLERVAFLLQGVENMYEIDVMFPVIEKAEELTGKRYGADHEDDVRFRVVADHIRSSMMLIGDGVTPGNEGRGYVLRRLLRRAVRSMRLLGYEDPALPELFPVSRDKMAETYTELHRDWDRISTVAFAEEHAFRQTLRTGTTIFDTAATEVRSGGGTVLSGDKAFALHDTYGFPIDLTLEMAAEKGLQRRRGRLPPADGRAARAGAGRREGEEGPAGRGRAPTATSPTRSATRSTSPATPTWSARARSAASSATARPSSPRARAPEIELVLDRTPFYAEGGGQLADQGVIELDNGARIEVYDVQSPISGLIVHKAQVVDGEVIARRPCPGAGRRRAPRVDQPLAHGDPHGAQGVPRGAGRDRDAGGLGELAGTVPLRLLRVRCGARVGDGRRRGAGQRPRDGRPRRARGDHDPGRGRPLRARWRCSGRSTATRCAWSPSATGPASSAVARTPTAPASSAWSSCSARARSVPAYDGSRRWSAATPTASSPVSTCSSPSSARRSRCAPSSCPSASTTSSTGSATAEKEIEQVRLQQLLASAGQLVDARRGPRRGLLRRAPRRGGQRRRRAHPRARRARPDAGRPAGRGRGHRLRRAASPPSWWPSTTPRERPASRRTRWCARPPRCSAARAAARTTSPRAVAPTRPRRARRWPRSAARLQG